MVQELKQTPFVRQLAANDKPTRDAALDSLKIYLSGRRELPSNELLKLWKGLFYCMWMSDRPLTQQALVKSLAELVFILPAESVLQFLRAFWQTMQREWTNIDVLRMEKYLLLTRRYFSAGFELLERKLWDKDLVDQILVLLAEIPCNTTDIKIPNGMRYHIIDIYIDELERLGYLTDTSDCPLPKLLEPLKKLAENSVTKTVRLKAQEALQDKRLHGDEKNDEIAETDEWSGF